MKDIKKFLIVNEANTNNIINFEYTTHINIIVKEAKYSGYNILDTTQWENYKNSDRFNPYGYLSIFLISEDKKFQLKFSIEYNAATSDKDIYNIEKYKNDINLSKDNIRKLIRKIDFDIPNMIDFDKVIKN